MLLLFCSETNVAGLDLTFTVVTFFYRHAGLLFGQAKSFTTVVLIIYDSWFSATKLASALLCIAVVPDNMLA